jgi:hypothetical protein
VLLLRKIIIYMAECVTGIFADKTFAYGNVVYPPNYWKFG